MPSDVIAGPWGRLAAAMRGRPRVEEKASKAGPLVALTLAGRALWTPRDYASLAREGFERNAVAYRCVRMIAEAAAGVPWLLYEGERELTEHPLLRLLETPNPTESGGRSFRELVRLS